MSGLCQEEVTVALHLAQQSSVAVRPLVDLGIDLRVQAGNGSVGQIVGQLVIVVHQKNGHNGPGTDVLVAHLQKLRQIQQIDHRQHHPGAGVLFRQDRTADAVTAVVITKLGAVLRLAAREPLHGKARKDLRDPRRDHRLAQLCQRGKRLVAPDQLVIVQFDQRHREGHLAGGAVHQFAGGTDIRGQCPFPPGIEPIAASEKQQRHARLRRRKNIMPQHQRRDAEKRHYNKIHHHAGLNQPAQLFIQATHSFRLSK